MRHFPAETLTQAPILTYLITRVASDQVSSWNAHLHVQEQDPPTCARKRQLFDSVIFPYKMFLRTRTSFQILEACTRNFSYMAKEALYFDSQNFEAQANK